MSNIFQIIRALAISALFISVGFSDTTNNLIIAHFQPAKTNYFLDEPIAVYLTVLSQYTNTVYISDYMRAEFNLCPENGVTDKVSDISHRMVSMVVPLLPQGQVKKTYYINESLKFEKPGKYYVDCTAEVMARDVKGVKVHNRISFTLAKGSTEQLSKVYGDLLEEAKIIQAKNPEACGNEPALALSSVRNPLVVPYLIKALMIPDYLVQESTVQALAEIGTPEAIKGLTDLDLTDRKTMFLRQFTAEAFGRMKVKESVPFLIKLLNDDIDSVQVSAIQALGKIGTAECLDAIRGNMSHFKGKVKNTVVEVLDKSSHREDSVPVRSNNSTDGK